MKIAENTTNEELMQRELGKFENARWALRQAEKHYHDGLLDMFEYARVAKEQSAKMDKAATLYKIAELAYQLEVKYGRE